MLNVYCLCEGDAMIRNILMTVFVAGFLGGAVFAETGVIGKVTVEAGKYDRVDTPVWATLTGVTLEQGDGVSVVEVTAKGKSAVPCQASVGEDPNVCWILSGKTAAGGRRVFEVRAGIAKQSTQVTVEQEAGYVDIVRGGKQAVRYNSAIVPVPKGANKIFERGAFIHPLWSPAGHELTRIHPSDHVHHLGLWGPWTKTHIEGREIDFWNLAKGQGTIRFVKFNSTTSGEVFGGFEAQQEHLDLKSSKTDKVAIKEKLNVKVWNVGPGFLIDYTSKQKCVLDVPITLDMYRYGGFGFRATEKWKGSDRGYLTSEGKGLADADGTTARWCDVYGPMGDGRSGVLFMSHVENRAHPEPVRIWGKGFNETFFNFCPIKRDKWVLEPGQEYVRKYRLYVYDGKMTVEQAECLWQGFANPPKTVFERKSR